MANTDQNITELPIKTASEVLDADYMLGIDLVEGYQVSTKDFADYAVNRAAISIGGKTQTTASAISEVRTTAGNAQPKESGKGLSANDFTNAYKSKLDGIAAGAEVNVQSDWNASSGDAAILHKPTTISGYGITDAYTKTQTDTALAAKSDKSTTYTKTEVDEIFDEKGLVDEEFGSDQAPYLFRKSGGDLAEIGESEYDKIVGGSVAWNQLHNERDGADKTNIYSGMFGSFWSFTTTLGHIYYVAFTQPADCGVYRQNMLNFNCGYMGYNPPSVATRREFLGKGEASSSSSPLNVAVVTKSNTTETAYHLSDLQFIDLTLLFGSTIADYIYSLEQANEGDGVAFFKKFFPKNYYPYDAGSIQSVSGLMSHDTVEFNQWDEEWEVGALNSDGSVDSSSNRRTTSFIPVIPNTTYYQKSPTTAYIGRYAFYNADKQIVKYDGNGVLSETKEVTSPENAHYLRITFGVNYGTTYNHDICINISDPAKNGTYEPYVKHSYPLDSSLTLRGIPKLDENNKLYYDGDIYKADGSVERRYGIVDLGTLSWEYATSQTTGISRFQGALSSAKGSGANNVAGNILCPLFMTKAWDAVTAVVNDKTIAVLSVGGIIAAQNSAYTDAAAFTTAMSGVYLVYELATPTTESAQPFQSPQKVDALGTEEYVTTSIVPVGHETRYVTERADKMKYLPDKAPVDGDYFVHQEYGDMSLVSSDVLLAPILGDFATAETSPASASHAVGEYLLYNNRLYKVLAAISAGQQLTIGTNIGQTNVAAELASQASAISVLNSKMSTPIPIELAASAQTYIDSLQGSYIRLGKIVVFSMKYTMKQAITSSLTVTNSLPRSIGFSPFLVTQVNTGSLDINKVFVVETNGSSQIRNPHPAEGTFAVSGVYISEYDT